MHITLEGEALKAYGDSEAIGWIIQTIVRMKKRALSKEEDERYSMLHELLELHLEFCAENGINLSEKWPDENHLANYLAAKKRIGL